jgi:hypothetical protein
VVPAKVGAISTALTTTVVVAVQPVMGVAALVTVTVYTPASPTTALAIDGVAVVPFVSVPGPAHA